MKLLFTPLPLTVKIHSELPAAIVQLYMLGIATIRRPKILLMNNARPHYSIFSASNPIVHNKMLIISRQLNICREDLNERDISAISAVTQNHQYGDEQAPVVNTDIDEKSLSGRSEDALPVFQKIFRGGVRVRVILQRAEIGSCSEICSCHLRPS